MSAVGTRTFVLAILRERANPAREGSERVTRIVVQADGARWDEDTEPAAHWPLTHLRD